MKTIEKTKESYLKKIKNQADYLEHYLTMNQYGDKFDKSVVEHIEEETRKLERMINAYKTTFEILKEANNILND